MSQAGALMSLQGCFAPAKLNLFLHVVGRNADGYHQLQTIFQLLDYGDELDFSLREDGLIRRVTDLPGVPEESDLVVRAARLLKEAAEAREGRALPGVDIALYKRLPGGGGLGGGSSDAATTMMALNHLWQTGFSRTELMALGLKLGADVPFFLFGRNAFAEGVGEVLTPIQTPDCWYVVIEPGVVVPTAEIFGAEDLTRDTEPVKITDFLKDVDVFDGSERNDLQPVACRLFPEVSEALKWLERFGKARMTGSGACVFCPLPSEQEADTVLSEVPKTWRAWKAKAMSYHPMAALLD